MRFCFSLPALLLAGSLLLSSQQVASSPDQTLPCDIDADFSAYQSINDYSALFRECTRAGLFEKAISVALRSKQFAATTATVSDDASALLLEASALQFMGLYEEALLSYEKIRNFGPNTKQTVLWAAENNSAVILQSLGQYDEALKLVEHAVDNSKDESYAADHVLYVGTMASVLTSLKALDSAEQATESCLQLAKKNKVDLALVYCSQTKAALLFEKGLAFEALRMSESAIQLANEKRVLSDIADMFLIRAKALAKLNHVEAAVAAAQQGIVIASEQNDTDSALKVWSFLEQLYRGTAQWQRAYEARVKAADLSQKLFDLKLANTLAYQRAQRGFEQQLQQIALLQSANELHLSEVKSARNQRTAAFLIAALVATVIILFFLRWMHKRDLKRAEQTNQELERLHRLKDQFLANTSHELRTPLNGIIGLSDLLLESPDNKLSEDSKESLNLIRQCGLNLTEHVDSILEFSKLRAGKVTPALEKVELSQLINAVHRLMLPVAQKQGLAFQVEMPSPVYVHADPKKLKQILHNLVSNAIKFTDQGHIKICVSVSGELVNITVSDSGIGIAPSDVPSIFEPFEQVDGSAKRRHSGVGLGLAIAKELVKVHGAELTVSSTLNSGSAFSFSLQAIHG